VKKRTAVLGLGLALFVSVASGDPLSGAWVLNVGRTHYGGGAEARRSESFVCEGSRELLRCTTRSVRLDGRSITGSFTAAYDGKPYVVAGVPDVDRVVLRRVDDHVADACFFNKGGPVFGYRAVKSDDGRSLTIVSVSPVTRKMLNSVVAYDRR